MWIGSVQKLRRHLTLLLLGVALLMVADTGAKAQQPAPSPRPTPRPVQPAAPAAQPATPAPSNSPQRTTATYDDWIVQCETVAGPPPRKLCEMTQNTQMTVQGRSQPFSRVSIVQPSKDLVTNLVIQLPVNITIATNLRVQSADNDTGIAGPFTRCNPNGCFAELELKDEALKKFRAANGAGKLSFADSTGQSVSVPVSFNGFGKAYDALLKE
jgi:invasion protein IalB